MATPNNTELTASVIGKEALRILSNNLVFVKKCNRNWETEYGNTVNGYKIGSVLNIRKPARFLVSEGPALAPQSLSETQVSLTIGRQHHIDTTFTTGELTLNLSDFSERVLRPKMITLANWIDAQALSMVINGGSFNYSQGANTGTFSVNPVANLVGTAGTVPNSFLSMGRALQKLNEEAAPTGDEINALLQPVTEITMADALKGLFVTQAQEAVEKGYIGTGAGMDWFLSQGLPIHTNGAYAGSGTVSSTAGQTGSSITTTGWTASITGLFQPGDTFTIANVFAVNPYTKQSTGALRSFAVTSVTNSDGSGNATINIYPAIVATGASQNVSAAPGSLAAITVTSGSASTGYAQNLVFHRDAFAFASVPMELPKGVHFAEQHTDKDTGITLRIVQAYDITGDTMPCRMDVLWGIQSVFPELACRVTN